MSIVLNIDAEAQQTLEATFGPDLSRTALEALAAEGYRTAKLSRHQVQTLLQLPDRWATERWLKAHDVAGPLSLDTVLEDLANSRLAREAACSSSQTPRP